tara:strand:- start:4434 stop:4934 length:501 start_codon:yes stop_codon:yes gene_type:complete
MTKKRRTAQELIEEQEQRLIKLREKASLEQAKQSPELSPIVDAVSQETASITEAQRGLGAGPQSFSSRASKHEAWLDEISKAERLAELVLETSTERKEYLTDLLGTLSLSLSLGDDISIDILDVLANIPSSEHLEAARTSYELAHEYRKSLSSSSKQKESSDDQPQ